MDRKIIITILGVLGAIQLSAMMMEPESEPELFTPQWGDYVPGGTGFSVDKGDQAGESYLGGVPELWDGSKIDDGVVKSELGYREDVPLKPLYRLDIFTKEFLAKFKIGQWGLRSTSTHLGKIVPLEMAVDQDVKQTILKTCLSLFEDPFSIEEKRNADLIALCQSKESLEFVLAELAKQYGKTFVLTVVGDGVKFKPDFFEKVIFAGPGGIDVIEGSHLKDSDVQYFLRTETLGSLFESEDGLFFVYHKGMGKLFHCMIDRTGRLASADKDDEESRLARYKDRVRGNTSFVVKKAVPIAIAIAAAYLGWKYVYPYIRSNIVARNKVGKALLGGLIKDSPPDELPGNGEGGLPILGGNVGTPLKQEVPHPEVLQREASFPEALNVQREMQENQNDGSIGEEDRFDPRLLTIVDALTLVNTVDEYSKIFRKNLQPADEFIKKRDFYEKLKRAGCSEELANTIMKKMTEKDGILKSLGRKPDNVALKQYIEKQEAFIRELKLVGCPDELAYGILALALGIKDLNTVKVELGLAVWRPWYKPGKIEDRMYAEGGW